MKKIVQFGFVRVDASSIPKEQLVDCRTLKNPYNKVDSDDTLRHKVRMSPGFMGKVSDGVALLAQYDTIYVGCTYGRHRSYAVAEEIMAYVDATIERL